MKMSALAPQIILYNGILATQNSAQPNAQAVAVGNGKILALGRDKDVLKLAGPDTEKIDLDGRLVVPGFIDSHIHFYEWALKRHGIKLDDLTCLEELLARVRKAAASRPPGQWIMGQGWNETDWTEQRMPTRETLDRVAPAHPVLLWRCDLHLVAANTLALKKAEIHRNTEDPPGGKIEHDDTGVPTGILRELAINMVRDAIPKPAPPDARAALKDGISVLHTLGITGIHDIRLMDDEDGADALRAFQHLNSDGHLDLRCWVTLPGAAVDTAQSIGLQTGFGGDRLRIGHLKYFSDGGMGARTAWMIEPFLDAGYGMPMLEMKSFGNSVAQAESAGLAVMVHAVGDRANQELITLFETQPSKTSPSRFPANRSNIPHRIEHVQVIQPQDLKRLAQLPVAICANPSNMILDINLIDTSIGPRGIHAYAFRSLMDTGIPVMFGSDCPVCDPNPMIGIHAAVTRTRRDGTPQGGWYPDSKIGVNQAVCAYTATPAQVHGLSGQLGKIAPGCFADLVVLDRNIFTIEPAGIHETRVDLTIFDGRVVFSR